MKLKSKKLKLKTTTKNLKPPKVLTFELWFLVFSFSFLVLPFFSGIAAAEEEPAETKEPIIVNGDRVEYLYEQKKILGMNNVVITYKDIILTCDKIIVDTQTKEAVAEGRVELIQKEGTFRGEKVHYNFGTQRGTVIQAEARADPWYGRGEVASKVADKQYNIDRGYMTTCELPNPHYRMQARRVKFYLDDKVVANHILFFLGNVPVFYFPYYVHPLQDKRPRVSMVAGNESRWGFFLLTAWRYYLHEWSRGYIHLDWREKKGFAEGIDYKYKAGYFGKGLVRFYHTNENHFITTDEKESEAGTEFDENRWRFQWRHKWELDPDTTAVGEFHKLSDENFLKDYYYRDEYEDDFEKRSYFSLIRSRPEYNLGMEVAARTNRFFTEIEKLPELEFEFKNQRLANTRFYYRSTTQYAMLRKKFEDTLISRRDKTYLKGREYEANRIDTEHEFSYVTELFRFLNVTPFLGMTETWYSKDNMSDENIFRQVYKTGVGISTKFSRIFPFKTSILELDINKLRHIITPSMTYTFIPTPNVKKDQLNQFDYIDERGYQNNVAFSVVNRLQTKRYTGEIVNLARLTTTSGLNIHPKTTDNDSRISDDYVDDVNLQLEVDPYDWLAITADSNYGIKRGRENGIEFANFDIVAEKEDMWRFGLGYRFEQGYDEAGNINASKVNNQVVTDMYLRISPKLKIKLYHRFKKPADKPNMILEDQTYGIERDLHCWIGELYYELKRTEGREADVDHRVMLIMRLKAFPELPIRLFRTTYSTVPSASRRSGTSIFTSTYSSPSE